MTVLADALTLPGDTPLSAFAPLIFAVGLFTTSLVMLIKARNYAFREMKQWLASEEGTEIVHRRVWTVLEHERYLMWLKEKVASHAGGEMRALIPKLESLTDTMQELLPRMDKLTDRIEGQQGQITEIEKQRLQDKIELLEKIVEVNRRA